MKLRPLGRTGRTVSPIGLGTWQLGADWGAVDDDAARAVLDASFEAGVTMYDTADVYGDGRSESRIGAWRADRGLGDSIFVATKMGRRVPLDPAHYTLANFREWIDRSRRNLGVDTLDLVQLHCPPEAVYASDEVFDALDTLVAEQAIAAYGVSVETTGQALASIARPGVASVQKPRGSASSPACRSRAGCSRVATTTTLSSPPTTTARTTGTANRSTPARRSRESTTTTESRRRGSSRRSRGNTASSPRRPPSRGSPSCRVSAPPSRVPAAPRRRPRMPQRDRSPRWGQSSPLRCATCTTDASARLCTTAGDLNVLGRQRSCDFT